MQLGQTTFPELAASLGKVVLSPRVSASAGGIKGPDGHAHGCDRHRGRREHAAPSDLSGHPQADNDMAGAINKVATDLQEQGKLAGGPLVDAWIRPRPPWRLCKSGLSKCHGDGGFACRRSREHGSVQRNEGDGEGLR